MKGLLIPHHAKYHIMHFVIAVDLNKTVGLIEGHIQISLHLALLLATSKSMAVTPMRTIQSIIISVGDSVMYPPAL
jgi:hypothetical protein